MIKDLWNIWHGHHWPSLVVTVLTHGVRGHFRIICAHYWRLVLSILLHVKGHVNIITPSFLCFIDLAFFLPWSDTHLTVMAIMNGTCDLMIHLPKCWVISWWIQWCGKFKLHWIIDVLGLSQGLLTHSC